MNLVTNFCKFFKISCIFLLVLLEALKTHLPSCQFFSFRKKQEQQYKCLVNVLKNTDNYLLTLFFTPHNFYLLEKKASCIKHICMLYDVKSLDVCKMKKKADPPTLDMEPCNVKVRNSRRKAKIKGLIGILRKHFSFFFLWTKNIGPVD